MTPRPDEAPVAGAGVRWIIFAAAFAWILALSALTLATANPVVVNRVQSLSADLIAIGDWSTRPPQRFTVTATLKGPVPKEPLQIDGWPATVRQHGTMIIPLTISPTGRYEVTQGRLFNPPFGTAPAGQELFPIESDVRPSVYPDTPAVREQFAKLLNRAAP